MKLEDALKTTRFADETHKATINLLYTTYWLKNNFSLAIKELGLTLEQFNVLRILKGKHPESLCVKDIAERIIEKNFNVPRIIDRLVAKDYVVRKPSLADKRETIISLTQKGLEILLEANEVMKENSARNIGITNDEAVLLNELLEKMRSTDK